MHVFVGSRSTKFSAIWWKRCLLALPGALFFTLNYPSAAPTLVRHVCIENQTSQPRSARKNHRQPYSYRQLIGVPIALESSRKERILNDSAVMMKSSGLDGGVDGGRTLGAALLCRNTEKGPRSFDRALSAQDMSHRLADSDHRARESDIASDATATSPS